MLLERELRVKAMLVNASAFRINSNQAIMQFLRNAVRFFTCGEVKKGGSDNDQSEQV